MAVETVESLGICSHIMAENYLLTVVVGFVKKWGWEFQCARVLALPSLGVIPWRGLALNNLGSVASGYVYQVTLTNPPDYQSTRTQVRPKHS
jgi:hypothetical protein